MKFIDIQKRIDELKKKEGKLVSNIIFSQIDSEEEAEALWDEKGVVFIVQEPNRKRAYYAVSDTSVLISLLHKVESGVVLECIHQKEMINEMEKFILESGFSFYKKYIRVTICYNENPHKIPEKGRRKLLQELYDPACGEYPSIEDARELYELTKETFDPLTDDVFTIDVWKSIIRKKECLVYREQGKIISYYVWRLEGKKLYSNISVNQGPANYLYNMERRAFETMWDKGIRVYYAWFDMENSKALTRYNKNSEKCITSIKQIFNSIYIKEME